MNIKRWLTAILIVVAVIGGLGLIKFNQIQAAIAFAATFPEPSATVKSTYVESVDHMRTIKVVGQLQAPRIMTISNEYAGPITEVGFKPGDVVEANQLLLQQDTSLERANLAAAKARHKLAVSTYERMEKLLSQDRISRDEVDRAEADVTIAEAEIANLSSVIDKKTIRAPFPGRVGLTQFQVGQLLDANSQITDLVGLDPTIWVDFSVPQTLPQLAIGDVVEVTVARLGTFKATVIAKNPSVDVNSRQQSYRAELSNQAGDLSHNQMASVLVPLARQQAVVVPTNAITRSHFGDFVYGLEKDEAGNWRASAIEVELGEKIQDQQMVLSGLNGGEFIASEGAFKLRDNILVYTQLPDTTESQVGGK